MMDQTFFAEEFFNSGTIISRNQQKLLIGWGKRTWQVKPDKESASPSFYFPDFFLENPKPWFTHTHVEEMSVSEFLGKIAGGCKNPRPPIPWQAPNKEHYQEEFERLQGLFADKTLEKAVPFAYTSSPVLMTPELLCHALSSGVTYMQTHPVHLYGFWEKQEGILGATPELLFSIKKNRLQSLALGGTYLPSKTEESGLSQEDQLNDEKLSHEHQVIVKGIIESLSPFGTVKTGKMHLVKFAKLAHLATDIEVDLTVLPDLKQVVDALHPTPALGSFPREAGKKWLLEYQKKIDRRRFGAPVGYYWKAKAEMICYVAIRNIQWTQEQLMLAAGGGVVQESQLEREWHEIYCKIDSVKEIFQL